MRCTSVTSVRGSSKITILNVVWSIKSFDCYHTRTHISALVEVHRLSGDWGRLASLIPGGVDVFIVVVLALGGAAHAHLRENLPSLMERSLIVLEEFL